LLAGAVGVSALGDWLAMTPLALRLQEDTGSGLVVAALFVALWGPVIVLAPLAGLLVDKLETRRLLALVSLTQAGVAVALAFADSPVGILVLAALLGSGFALAQPAEFALVPVVAGEAQLAQANGYVETARYAGFTLGPLIGGVLAAVGGTSIAMLVNAVTFLAVAGAALVIRAERRFGSLDRGKDRARDGIVFLFRDRMLGLVIGVAFVSLLFMTASAPAEVFFAKDVLEVGDVGFGALMTAELRPRAADALARVRLRARVLLRGRRGARPEERAHPDADPRARPGPPARAGVRRVQRPAQLRRALRDHGRRRAGGRDRRALDALSRGRHPGRGGARRARGVLAPARARHRADRSARRADLVVLLQEMSSGS
jgi:hypothetical protein